MNASAIENILNINQLVNLTSFVVCGQSVRSDIYTKLAKVLIEFFGLQWTHPSS